MLHGLPFFFFFVRAICSRKHIFRPNLGTAIHISPLKLLIIVISTPTPSPKPSSCQLKKNEFLSVFISARAAGSSLHTPNGYGSFLSLIHLDGPLGRPGSNTSYFIDSYSQRFVKVLRGSITRRFHGWFFMTGLLHLFDDDGINSKRGTYKTGIFSTDRNFLCTVGEARNTVPGRTK